MKIISKTFKLLTVFLLVLVATGCSDDDDNTQPLTTTVIDVAVENGLTSLAAALEATNLLNTIQQASSVTVFAPDNAAFDALLTESGIDLADMSPEEEAIVTAILLNHVIFGENIQAETLINAGSGYTSTTAPGPIENTTLSLYYNVNGGTVELNGGSDSTGGADVTIPNLTATNGIVHIIDAVLSLPDIVDHALNNDNFTSLTSSLVSENLVATLQGDGPFTVFAPTNDAFSDFSNPNSNTLGSILVNHVMNGVTLASDLVTAGSGYASTLANGPMDLNMNSTNLSLYYNTTDGVIINGSSEVIVTDVVGTNGVIHVVDTVIDLPTVVTFAVANPNFSTLVDALTTLTPSVDFAGILSTANGTSPAPFTVFAPTNDAFGALSAIPVEADLIPILQHHVVASANAVSGDLNADGSTSLSSLEGDTITITLPGTSPNIADVEDGSGNTDIGIIAVDVQASNGVIHVLNKVLIPDTTN
jgi:transforming growth factor-beta-induced protein